MHAYTPYITRAAIQIDPQALVGPYIKRSLSRSAM